MEERGFLVLEKPFELADLLGLLEKTIGPGRPP
jgi:hypothetical protein